MSPAAHIAGNARLEIRIDGDAALDRDPSLFGKCRLRPHTNTDDDEVGIEPVPALQRDMAPLERSWSSAEVEDDGVLLVNLAHEVADFTPEHLFHRVRFWCDDMHLDPAGAQ